MTLQSNQWRIPLRYSVSATVILACVGTWAISQGVIVNSLPAWIACIYWIGMVALELSYRRTDALWDDLERLEVGQ